MRKGRGSGFSGPEQRRANGGGDLVIHKTERTAELNVDLARLVVVIRASWCSYPRERPRIFWQATYRRGSGIGRTTLP